MERSRYPHRKPPEATRFKPGQSGNQKGRPEGVLRDPVRLLLSRRYATAGSMREFAETNNAVPQFCPPQSRW
jgi:hypothetical protein